MARERRTITDLHAWRARAACGVAALALALVPLACGGDDEDKSGGGKSGGPAGNTEKAIEGLPAKRIASRIEQIRGLEFAQVPSLEAVTPAESAAEGAKRAGELSKREQQASEEALKLLGLLPKETTTKGLSASIGEALLGFYDPRKKRLALVAAPALSKPKALETVAAHELLHALSCTPSRTRASARSTVASER